jgi:DNA primase
LGKTITKEQEDKLLKMPITHLIILTDNDQAGRESKTQIQRQLGRSFKLTFPKISTKDIGEMTTDQIKNKILPQVKGTY